MSELSRFLAPRAEALIERWTQRVGDALAPVRVSEPVLRDHIAEVLRALVASLDRGLVPETIVFAKEHGRQRFRIGFQLTHLVHEYGVLRTLIFDLAAEANLTRPIDELRVVADFISVAITEGVGEYDECQREEQRGRDRLLSEARLLSDSALTAGSVGTFSWDIPTDRIHGDASFGRLFGLELDDSGAAPLASYLAAIHPEDLAATTAKIERTIQEGGAYEAEYRITTGGRERWVVARGRVDRDEKGQPLRFPGVLMDITERKRSEEAQRALTARLATALAAGGLGSFDWDLRRGVLHLDERALEIFALAAGEPVTSAGIFERIDPLDRTRVQAETEDGIAAKPRMSSEYRVSVPGRSTIVVLSFGAFLRDPDGAAERMIGVFRDVTEERRAEAERAELLARAQAARAEAETARKEQHDLFMLAPVAICILEGPEHLYTFANPAYRALVNGRDVVGKTLNVALPDVREMGFDKLLDGVKETGEIFVARELPIKLEHHLGDELLYLDFSYTPKRDVAGNINGVLMTGHDVTAQVVARQRVEALVEELRTSEERYRTLFESIDQGFCLIEVLFDEHGTPFDYRYLQTNAGFENQTGMRDVVGKTIRELVPSIEPSWAEIYGRVVTTGEPARFESPVTGIERWFDVYASRVGPAEKHQVVVLFSDVTERKRMEVERDRLLALETEARQLAEEASRLKDDFLATVSHELRTPLTSILGWAEMLRTNTVATDRYPKAFETIERNARAQARLIEDLLDMSRIMSGKLALEIEPLDMLGIVEAAVESIRPAAEAKSIRLQPALGSCGIVMGDPNRLQQIVWNLLTNAVKFTPKGGRVQVLTQCLDSAVELTVADTGQGISSEFLPHVFERFRQAQGGTSRAKGGLGLGLSIVKQLVEMHGGTIVASSEGEGRGSSFVVRIPFSVVRRREALAPGLPSASASLPAMPGRELEGLRLLVVDDEQDTREMLSLMLEISGAIVAQASSAAEGRLAFAAARPDVLVSDIGMPGENGYAFIASIRSLGASGGNVPAVALTAYARSEDRTRALTAGFSSHVAKPVEPAELVAVIASLARR